jgi:hypothetical protein
MARSTRTRCGASDAHSPIAATERADHTPRFPLVGHLPQRLDQAAYPPLLHNRRDDLILVHSQHVDQR